MLDLVRRLATANRVMLFSNTNREHWEFLNQTTDGAFNTFEAYLSFELGAVKPSPDAFRLVAARAGIAPPRSLFVDDLAENVTGAEAVGFRGHVFTERVAFERFLATL
jgi:putative hydrolase of the HAD superfamily